MSDEFRLLFNISLKLANEKFDLYLAVKSTGAVKLVWYNVSLSKSDFLIIGLGQKQIMDIQFGHPNQMLNCLHQF